MHSDPYPKPELKDNRRFQLLPPQPSSDSTEDEGGLNLGQVVSALRRRIPIILGVTTLVTSAAVLKALTSTPIYQAGFDILTKPVTAEGEVLSSVPQTLASKQDQAAQKGVDATTLQLLKSPKILEPIAKQLQPKYPDLNYDALAAGLKMTPSSTAEILSVSFQDPKADKVEQVLKLTSKAFIDYSLKERLADVNQGIEFVDTQLPQLQDRVGQLQDELQSFRQKYNLIDPESASKLLTDQSNSVGQQLIEAEIKLREARALSADLENQLAATTETEASATALQDNKRYQALLDQILEVESQVAKKSSRFREAAPAIQNLSGQKDNLVPLLEREGQRVREQVASKIRDLEARNRILLSAQQELRQQIKELSVISRRYTDIQRELKIATDNLNQFLTKREALRIDAGQRKAPWQIVTPPGQPTPSAANARRSAVLGVILGLLLGTGVALVLDKLSNVLHSPDEVKDASKLPILGIIPYNAGLLEADKAALSAAKPLAIADVVGLVQQVSQKFGRGGHDGKPQYAGSPFLESFRSLYANICLLNSDTQIRSLVISSSAPGEGKSTISVYLAQAAAALGQRVLLVDADLRLPKVHERLGLLNSFGLSNVIASDIDVDRVIQQSPIESNMFVLTAGQVPPDPTKLLSSQKMQKLMEQFQATYDLVIFDSLPLSGLVDAKLIASRADGIVLVVGLGKVKAQTLEQTLSSLKQINVAILGVVANGSKDYKSTIYDTYHRYYAPSEEFDDAVLDELPPVTRTVKKN